MRGFAFQLCVALSAVLITVLAVAGFILNTVPVNGFVAFFVLAMAVLLFALISYRIIYHFVRPLNEAETMIKQLSEGNFNMRTYPYGQGRVSRINHLLNDLAASLQRRKQALVTQQDQLETLIENIGSSFLFIDGNGKVRMANRKFQRTFSMEEHGWFDKTYEDILPYKDVVNLIDETVAEETETRRTIVLPIGIERRHFEVFGAPIKHGFSRSRGIVVVFHDITELKKLEKMRKDFVANVSHELKTPVTSLKGFAETLLEEDTVNDEAVQRKFLNIIEKESDRLETLIDELLELSRIEHETFQLNWQTVDLDDVIEDVRPLLTEKARAKGIHLHTETDERISIDGDPVRLKQMFMNVIDNAIIYSPPARDVYVKVEDAGEKAVFSVQDKGIGMDEKEIPRIFERFYRVDKARSRNSGGTGLGLAIVKHLTEAHGGHIEVNSRKGEGTTMTITLPKNRE